MRAIWRSPIYIAQLLTGGAAIGAIFADGKITELRVYLATLAGLSAMASLLVAVRATSDSQRMQQYVETLLRSMELPYFIIENLSAVIGRIAGKHQWHLIGQENFEHETVYSFNLANSTVAGRLLMAEQEFKNIWLFDDNQRAQKIEQRLFGQTSADGWDESESGLLEAVVREALFEGANGPLWIGVHHTPEKDVLFTARQHQGDPEKAAFRITADRLQDLRAMIPIRRYAVAAQEAKEAMRHFSH